MKFLKLSSIILASVLCLGSCSDENAADKFVDIPKGEVLRHVDNLEGTVYYDWNHDKWYISNTIPNTIDAQDDYFPVVMTRNFCKRRLNVIFSGDVYSPQVHSPFANGTSYTIILTSIKKK